MEDPEYRPKRKNYGVCGFWVLMMLMILIGGLVFAVVYLITQEDKDEVEVWTTPASDSGVCETPECITLAAALFKNTDPSIEPCDNFFDFACENWIRRADTPGDVGRAHVQLDLVTQLEKDVKYVLESPDVPGEPGATRKAKTMYRSCMDKDKREAVGIAGLLENSQYDLGGWPILEDKSGGNFKMDNFNLTGLLAKLFSKYGSSSVIDAEAIETPDDPTQFNLVIKAGKITAHQTQAHLLDDTANKEQRDAYLKYMTDIAVEFGAPDARAAGLEMQAVLALEIELAQAKEVSTPTPTLVKTVGEMQMDYPEINWTEFLNNVLPSGVGPVTDEFTLVDADSEYLRAALDIISAKPARLTADWMLWLCFEDFTSFFTEAIRDIYYEYNSAITGRAPSSYYQDCVTLTDRNLKAATGRLYVDKFFPAESKTMVEDLASDILDVMADLVKTSDNFDANTTLEAVEKLQSMEVNVGYPDYILDDDELDMLYSELVIPRDKLVPSILNAKAWAIRQNLGLLENVTRSKDYLIWRDVRINAVNASYNPTYNSLNLHVGSLQEPIFSKDAPWYINSARLGTVIARTASDAISDVGDYTTGKECIKTQYGGYTIGEANLPLNIDMTHPEDLADSLGMQTAVKAFAERIESGYQTSQLPGLNMTSEELFFLSHVQAWCDKYAPEKLSYWLSIDSGSPGRFRVTGMLQNSEYFAEVFSCPAGSYMNPSDKCVLW